MKNEDTEAASAAAAPGRWHFIAVRELRAIDGLIGFFQRLRNRIEPPAEDADDFRRGRSRRHAEPHKEEPVPAAVIPTAPPRHGRWRGILIATAAMATGAGVGFAYSYSLLLKSIETGAVVIDDLRDQVKQLEKEDAMSAKVKDRYLRQATEAESKTTTCRETLAELREEADGLRQQIVLMQRQVPVAAAAPGAAAPARGGRPLRPRTNTCLAGGANTSGNLADCLGQLNR